MHVLGEELNSQRQMAERQLAPHVVHHIHQDAVRHRSHRVTGGPARSDEDVLVEELVDARDEAHTELCAQDVARRHQQVPPQVGHFVGTVLEE